MTGYILISLSLILTLLAAYYFYALQFTMSASERQSRLTVRARYLYGIASALIWSASVLLVYLILTNRFEHFYVFRHSTPTLPVIYKITAFWAGQEGSFLLWAALHSLLGFALLCKSQTPARVMSIYCLVQGLLLAILMIKTPFMMVGGAVPADGLGLNPMLQDFWMIIHPPVIFLGYAGMAVPFAYAIEGALSGQHAKVIRLAMPWTLLAWGILGLGIFIGAFWAYKVLGWGGYWAWDPVENASLVPWLFSGAAIHLMILAIARPGGVRFAYLAMVLSFILVLYGTFITRSGIMANFSTHSFPDEGLGAALAFGLMTMFVASVSILILKWPSFDSGLLWDRIRSRDFLLVMAAGLLITETALVFCGMSLPLFTAAIGQTYQVGPQFYNLSSLPIALTMIFLLCSIPLWQHARNRTVSIALPSVLAHVGIVVMIIGIITSSAGNHTITTSVRAGDQFTVFGQEIRYAGKAAAGASGYRNIFHLTTDTAAAPVFSQTKLNADGSPNVTEPAIHRGLLADIYIAPSAGDTDTQEVSLTIGEQTSIDILTIQFTGFKMADGMQNNQPGVHALLSAMLEGKTEQCAPALYMKGSGFASSTEILFDRYKIQLLGVEPKEKKIVIGINDIRKDKVVIEISRKPLVSFVWIGSLLITVGAVWSGGNKLYQKHYHNQRTR